MVSSLKALENNAGSVKKVIRACVVTAQGEALGLKSLLSERESGTCTARFLTHNGSEFSAESEIR